MRTLLATFTVLLASTCATTASATAGTIYFTTGSPEPRIAQLWSVREDGSGLERLRRQMPVGPQGGTATLARDGRHLLCLCKRGEVDSVRLDGSHLRRLGPQPPGTRYDLVTLSATGWAFWVEGYTRVFAQQVAGGKRFSFAASKSRSAAVDLRVVPSPDGQRIAYAVYGCLQAPCPSEDVQTLVSADLDGSDRTVVYRGEGLAKEIWDVAWSPDGSQLVFTNGTGEGDPKGELPVSYPRQLFVVPADGSEPQGRPLPFPETASDPAFSPAGDRLVLSAVLDQRFALQITPLDSFAPTPLPGTSCRAYCEFSPRPIAWAAR
jgi:WD40 repeat protein